MSLASAQSSDWQVTLRRVFSTKVLTMLFLGFAAGLPILMIFSSLSLWLSEAGIERKTVTMFSWAALGYSFKFVWAPIVDRLPLPLLTRALGRRRAWLLVAQAMIIASIVAMALIDPALGGHQLTIMALAAVALGFSSATQDIVIDAYRIESASADMQALLSSAYIGGYRIAMLLSGAGLIVFAELWGSTAEHYSYAAWRNAYLVMAVAMLIGVATTLLAPEPSRGIAEERRPISEYLRFLLLFLLSVAGLVSVYVLTTDPAKLLHEDLVLALGNKALASALVETLRLLLAIGTAMAVAFALLALSLAPKAMVNDTYINPVKDFFNRYGFAAALLLLAIIGLYRISDIVLGVMSNVFYKDMGFSKQDIALAVKTFGLWMTIIGGFAGGLLAVRFGLMRILITGAILAAGTNLLFLALAKAGQETWLLYLVVGADNLVAGLASAAFVAFLSSLTNISFTAMQYAIFSSLMTLIPKVLGGYSGGIVDAVGYESFFIITACLGLPVISLLLIAQQTLHLNEPTMAK